MLIPAYLISALAFVAGALCIYSLRINNIVTIIVAFRAGAFILSSSLIFFSILYFYYAGHDIDPDIRQRWVRAGLTFHFMFIIVWQISSWYVGKIKHGP